MSLVSLRDVSKSFSDSPEPVLALNRISLDIEKGEFLAIMGPSGSGKSTLLSILGALSPPTDGEVFFEGTSLYSLSADALADFRSRHLGFVFQQLYLLPYLTAIQNVMLPLLVTKDYSSPGDRASDALRQVGLEDKLHRLPGELSAGEQARVAIARALVKAPPMILTDEPTGNLDSKTGEDVVRLLKTANERGHTIILVTHDSSIARKAGRSIYLRDGKILADHE
ncbi:MAG: ABC transporter ATP-binding protein [Thermodesulfobacteriota bacterium]